MPTNFPSSYDTFATLIDNVNDIRAASINVVYDAVTQIERTLGINVMGANQPQGWTLANRLQKSLNEDGTIKPNAFNPTLIPPTTIDPTKIIKDTTWTFQRVLICKNDNGSYGYTGLGPGLNAGTTLDNGGVILNDGGFITQGYIQTNGLTATGPFANQHVFGAPVNIQANVFLGASSLSVIEWTGLLRPSATVTFDLGDPTHRINNLYAQNIIGAQAGGTTLVVSASATFGSGTQLFNIITTGTAPSASQATNPYMFSDGTNLTIAASLSGAIDFESPLEYKGTPLFSNESFINWVENSKFDKWASGASSLPNLWSTQGSLSATTRTSSPVKYSPYAVSLTTSSTNSGISQVLTNNGVGKLAVELLQNQPFYFFADVYSGTSGTVFLQLNDGFTLFDSDYLIPTNQYTRLIIQSTLSSSASTVQVRILSSLSGITFLVGAVGFYQGQLPKSWSPHPADLTQYYD